MSVRRILAAAAALALGVGGALVVAAPASAAALTVTKPVDDGSVGTLSYALGQLDPGVTNTIDISVGGTITGPAAGFPTIVDDVDITTSAGTRPVLLMDATGGSLNVSGATLSMTGIDILSDTADTGQGISVLDGSLVLSDVTVRDFETNVFFWDQAGAQSLTLTDVGVGGSAVQTSTYGVVAEGLDGPITLTRVSASFTSTAGIGVGTDGGTVALDSVSSSDGGGIVVGDYGGSTITANQLTTARASGVDFVLNSTTLTLTDVQATDTVGVGLDVRATNGSIVTARTLRVSTSDDSGIVLDAADSSIDVSDVVSNGNGVAAGCGCGGGEGSGIELWADTSTVTLSDAESYDNTASMGGGVYIAPAIGGSTVSVSSTSATDNSSTTSGGGFYLDEVTDASTVTLTDVTASDNTTTFDGGGIYLLKANSGATVTISGALVTGNTSSSNGGGIALIDVEDSGTTATITGSTVSDNDGQFGAGIATVGIRQGSTVSITGTTVSDNVNAGIGGGILILAVEGGSGVTVSGSTVTGNVSNDDGGGIQIENVKDDDSFATVADSTVSGNTAADYGGGIYLKNIGDNATSTAKATIVRTTVDDNDTGGYGAGIAITDAAEETSGQPKVLVDSSTVSNNTSPSGGGGMYIGAAGATASVVQVLNSTLTGNLAQAGGGIYLEGFMPLTLQILNSTIADNTAHTSGGVEDNNAAGVIEISNSILSGATSDNGSTPDDLSSPNGVTVSYSLVQSPGAGVVVAGAGNLTGVSPQLAPLANNGGPTRTMLLAPGSPAYNAGNPAFAGAGLLDQRGQARVFQVVDMGAVEWHPALAATGSDPEPEPPLLALLLILSGLAMVAFSRLQAGRSVG